MKDIASYLHKRSIKTYLKMYENILFALVMSLPIIKCAVPGTFFWRPRLGLDLSIPTTEISMQVHLPTKENIQEGLVVMIDGYQMGMTVVALAAGISSAKPYPHLNPLSAYFYTNAYRWALRHLSLIPLWIGGNGGNYCDTHKVWRRRFFYMDEFVPPWMKHLFPFIDKNEWKKEEIEFKRFKNTQNPLLVNIIATQISVSMISNHKKLKRLRKSWIPRLVPAKYYKLCDYIQ